MITRAEVETAPPGYDGGRAPAGTATVMSR